MEAHCCGLTQDVPFGQQFSSLSSPSAKPTDPQEATAESMVRVWVALVACSFVGAFRAARPFVGSACWPNIFFKIPTGTRPQSGVPSCHTQARRAAGVTPRSTPYDSAEPRAHGPPPGTRSRTLFALPLCNPQYFCPRGSTRAHGVLSEAAFLEEVVEHLSRCSPALQQHLCSPRRRRRRRGLP